MGYVEHVASLWTRRTMALRSIVPFSCTPLLRRFPSARTTAIPRTGFRTRRGTESIERNLSCDHRSKLISSPNVFFSGDHGRAQQLGADLRSVRAKSGMNRQEVAAGEEFPGANPKSRLLILYSKPGCCLCDGLKEKLEGSEIFPEIQLEVRDITTNSEWWNLYQYEIPVLARVRGDGTEEPLPRLSPRLSGEQVQKKIRALMRSVT